MLKRLLLLPLFALLTVPLAAQEREALQTDSVYEFRFVPRKDMFSSRTGTTLPNWNACLLWWPATREP